MKHSFTGNIAGKAYCVGCGLVALRNALTDWCVKKGCDYQDHPGYRRAVAELPEKHRVGGG